MIQPRAAASPDTIDVADVARTIRRQWRAVLGGLAFGIVTAAAIVLFAPRKFAGNASVHAKGGGGAGGSIAGRMEGIGELLGGLSSLSKTGTLETELQLLKSRQLAGQVVDSLQLQVRVKKPAGTPTSALVASSRFPGGFAPRTYEFTRTPAGTYRAELDGQAYDLTPGRPGGIGLGEGTLTLREGGLPETFRLKIYDREDAITRFGSNLTASKGGGDVAKVKYSGDDSLTAAAGANLLVQYYLDRRRTVDRGLNTRRVELVTRQLDSVARQLTETEHELRRYQEASAVLDAAVVGQVELQAAANMRGRLTELQVEEAGVKQLLAQVQAGTATVRDLAANPTFVRGAGITHLFNQLNDLEAQRIRLLERRTERDPDVRALDSTMTLLQSNILAVTSNYAASLGQQRRQVETRLDSIQTKLLALPAAAERGGRLARDVQRLTSIHTALEAQLVEARLSAIGEGGEAKQVDVAVPQRKVSFPRPVLTMGIGTAGGLLVGMVAAMFMGWFGRWLRDPVEIERAVGVSAQRIDADTPLLLANTASARSLLVVPLDRLAHAGAGMVAERLARTARQRALKAQVLDLSGGHGAGNGKPAMESATASDLIDRMEQDGVAIIQLPELASDVTLTALRETRPVLLVAPPGPVDRARLGQAVEMLRRLQVPCAGVVISDVRRPRALV